MPELRPVHVVEMPRVNVLIRLTPEDTRFLLGRIQEMVLKGRGANLILYGMRGRVCVIDTDERGWELAVNAFASNVSHVVRSEQKGYEGKWSHVELVFPLHAGLEGLEEFVATAPR